MAIRFFIFGKIWSFFKDELAGASPIILRPLVDSIHWVFTGSIHNYAQQAMNFIV